MLISKFLEYIFQNMFRNSCKMMQNQWKFSNFAQNKDCNYEKIMLATMTLLTMSWLFPSCEKETFYISPTMEAYYIESTRLLIVTADSVQSFSNKVNVFTRTYPLALKHEKYPAIKENIRSSIYPLHNQN